MRRYKKGGTTYRSKFELEIATWFEKENISFVYEPHQIEYTVPESKHKYTPDWQINGEKHIYFESKGRLTATDRAKLLHIIKSNPHISILMILQNSTVKIRKNSKTTYADWCDKHGIAWADWKDKRKINKWCKK